MKNSTVKAIAWISVSLAVIAGMIITQSAKPLSTLIVTSMLLTGENFFNIGGKTE